MFIKISRKKRIKESKEDAECAELNAFLVGFSSHNFLEKEGGLLDIFTI